MFGFEMHILQIIYHNISVNHKFLIINMFVLLNMYLIPIRLVDNYFIFIYCIDVEFKHSS